MICKNCGASLDDNSVFCSKCGYTTDISSGNGINPDYKPSIHRTHKKGNRIIGISIIVIALAVGASNILFFNCTGTKEIDDYAFSIANDSYDNLENDLNIDINQFAGLSYKNIEDILGEPIEVSNASDDNYYIYDNNGFLYKFIFKHKKVSEVEISNVPYENDAVIFNALQIYDMNKFNQVNDTGYAKRFVADSSKDNETIKQVLIQGINEDIHTAEKIKISYR